MTTENLQAHSADKNKNQDAFGFRIFIIIIVLLLVSYCSDPEKNAQENKNRDDCVLCQITCKERARQSDYFDKKACDYNCEKYHHCKRWF